MKTDSLDINGSFKIERLSSLPTWDPSYVGRIVYNLSENELYVGKSTGWSKAGGSYSLRPDWDQTGDGTVELFLFNYIRLVLLDHSGDVYTRLYPWDVIASLRGSGEPYTYYIRKSTENYGVGSSDPKIPYLNFTASDPISTYIPIYVKVSNSLGSEMEVKSYIVIYDTYGLRPRILDPNNTSSKITLSESNLRATNINDGTWHMSKANYSCSTSAGKKHYWEFTVMSAGNLRIGVHVSSDGNEGVYVGANYDSYGYDNTTGNSWRSSASTAYGNTYTTGDVIGVAISSGTNGWDGYIWFSKNGVWQNSGDPVTGVNPAYTDVRCGIGVTPSVSFNGSASARVNFGDTPFVYTPPTGFTDPLV